MTEGGSPTLALGPDARGTVILVAGDRIAGAGTDPPPPGVPRLACDGAVLEPGRVNAHTHLYSALAPLGMPPPASPPRDFLGILRTVWWRLDRALDAETLRASARYGAAEAILDGTTALIDHHESPGFLDGSLDVLADACEAIGVRAVLAYGATERNGGRDEGRRGLAECRRFHAANRRPLVRGVVGLHASFTVSDDTAREAGALAGGLGTVTHVHVAEDGADVADAVRRGWPGPLPRLLALGALPPGSILAHGIHLPLDDIRAAEHHGCWFVQNPRSNRGNRVGYPRGLAAARRVALGTDGYPARMADEIRALEEEAAAHGDDPAAVRLRPGAAHALLAERFGIAFAPLAPGAAADVVARDPGGRCVHAIVGGRVAVRDGRLVGADADAIRAEAADAAPRLWARMRAIPEE